MKTYDDSRAFTSSDANCQVVDGHSQILDNRNPCVFNLLILCVHRKIHQLSFSPITYLSECINTCALKIKPPAIKGRVVRVTSSHTSCITDRVASQYSIHNPASFSWTTAWFLAGNSSISPTHTALQALLMGVKHLVFVIIASPIEAATFCLWHTGLATQDVTLITLTGLSTGSAAVVHREINAGLGTAWSTGVVVAVWWAGQSCDRSEKVFIFISLSLSFDQCCCCYH